ncbi:MAG: PaaI family thioesterase [Oscillospiraceae bacterium]
MKLPEFDLSDFEGYERGNPFMAQNHIQIVSVGTDRSQVRMEITPPGRNLNGTVHGGLIYTMADCVAGITARADGRNYVTQSAHIDFLRNVSEGTLYATGEAVKRGRRVAVIHVKVEDQNQLLLADMSISLFCAEG